MNERDKTRENKQEVKGTKTEKDEREGERERERERDEIGRAHV